MTASTYLELMYGDGSASDRLSRATSRAATPMMVGDFSDYAKKTVRSVVTRSDTSKGLYPRLYTERIYSQTSRNGRDHVVFPFFLLPQNHY